MGGGPSTLTGPDLAIGIALSELTEGVPLLGHAGDDAVVLVKKGAEVYALSASCTHYGGPLSDGLVIGHTIRCPWHHARFDLRTGTPAAPALAPVTCFRVIEEGGRVRVAGKLDATTRSSPALAPESVVIVGAGAAAAAAADTLRREGYHGPITMIGAEASVPVDRPNLSKDYLAGNAPEEWVPLRPREAWEAIDVTLELGVRATAIDASAREIALEDGRRVKYGALLLATGASPVRLPIPGADAPHVKYLRSFDDCRAIVARLGDTKRAVVIGASFIGLEVAASLRARNIDVVVVAPELVPLARVMGDAIGAYVKKLHEDHGVAFRLGRTSKEIAVDAVVLDDGARVPAELVVVGVGVRPVVDLAETAGLRVEDGIVVDAHLQTSVPGIWAAGDVARYPDPGSGELVRVEHWVHAERMGQAAARNILGAQQAFGDAPFFWSQHYDVPIAYVGHARTFDRADVDGSPESGSCAVALRVKGRTAALVTIGRDLDSLKCEAAMEARDQARVEAIAPKG